MATDVMTNKKKEGKLTKEIEEYTSQIPSDAYLWSAVSVMGLSLTFKLLQKDEISQFIGQWAAPILIMGVYNKIVKTLGSD